MQNRWLMDPVQTLRVFGFAKLKLDGPEPYLGLAIVSELTLSDDGVGVSSISFP